MSVNVYLVGEKVREMSEFKIVGGKKKDGGSWKQFTLSGINLSYDKGRFYICLDQPTEKISSLLADIVDEVSFWEWFPSDPAREVGIYNHKSAEAEVESPRENSVRVRIIAKKMEDLLELYRKIRIGSIRPTKSYEGEQDGMSKVQLEKELKRLQGEKTELEEKLEILQGENTELDGKLAVLTEKAEKANWLSRCTRWLVALFRKLTFWKN